MILFVTQIPPNANGHGGSQRAMHILKGLAKLDTVDLLLVHRAGDVDSLNDDLSQVEGLVRSRLKVQISSWEEEPARWPYLSWRTRKMVSLLTSDSVTKPFLSKGEVRRVIDRLPARHYETVFACRIPLAAAADQMLATGLLTTLRKVLDFDDIMSNFRQRELDAEGATMGRFLRWLNRIDVKRLRNAERRALRNWDVISVCSDADVATLRAVDPRANVVRLSNVTDKAALPSSTASHPRLLFVGSLRFAPNIHGLSLFLQTAWPLIREKMPSATLDVVGMSPSEELAREIEVAGAQLHADVPSVEPFYRDCDIVIAPIFFGSGTRIKIIEAMAYERALVASTIGAEGLQIEPGVHALIADDMTAFADAVVRLASDHGLRTSLAARARALQQQLFSPETIQNDVASMVVRPR